MNSRLVNSFILVVVSSMAGCVTFNTRSRVIEADTHTIQCKISKDYCVEKARKVCGDTLYVILGESAQQQETIQPGGGGPARGFLAGGGFAPSGGNIQTEIGNENIYILTIRCLKDGESKEGFLIQEKSNEQIEFEED